LQHWSLILQKAKGSKLNEMVLEDLPFGNILQIICLKLIMEDGEWKQLKLKPYQPLLLSPSLSALHYARLYLKYKSL